MAVFWKTLVFTILVPGTVTVYVPYLLLRGTATHPRYGGLGLTGAALLMAGVVIYVWCAWEFGARGRGTPAPIDAPKSVVVTGLYRWVRNPMYIGVLGILIGEAALFRSLDVLAYTCVVWLVFHAFITLYEEPHLRRTFGASYAAYCASVPRWLPRPPKS